MPLKNGTNGHDWLVGIDDADVIYGWAGDDRIEGLGGDDIILGGAGADELIGGPGHDTAVYWGSPVGVWVSLYANVGYYGDAEGDTLYGIESLFGSEHNDVLEGDDNNNGLFGEEGNDVLVGYGGTDSLHGGSGDDWLFGGAGKDWLSAEGGNDWLVGGSGGDVLNGSTGSGNTTASYDGSPVGVFVWLSGNVALSGDAEGDKLSGIDNLWGSFFNDVLAGDDNANGLFGQAGNDNLVGFGGDDSLHGGSGDDWLFGQDGSDTLSGESGNDWLGGGMGGDTLYGGSGADTFAWTDPAQSGFGWLHDVITDFNRAEGDLMDLSAIDANLSGWGNEAFTFIGTAAFSGTPGEVRYYQAGGFTFIEMQTHPSMDLEGWIALAGLHTPDASWFVL
jgi:Ca2+-binding RTX toxin-like protein